MQEKQNNNTETKIPTTYEMQELINQSSQVLTSFKKLDSEIKFSVRDLQNQFNTLKSDIKAWFEVSRSLSSTLEKHLSDLAEETTILCLLPEKIDERLVQLIPDISTQVSTNIQKKCFEDYDVVLAKTNKLADQLNEKVQKAIQKAEQLNMNAFKKKLAYFALVLSITIVGSTALTYTIMQRFPTNVTIDTTGGVNVNGGNIRILEYDWNKTKKK